MSKHTISFTLDVGSVGRAIRQVQKYKDDLVKAVNELVKKLTEDGREAAVLNVLRLGAFDTGELADSFHTRGYYNADTQIGIIYTDCWYAVFVEYGTGIVGEMSPHPGPWNPGPVAAKGHVYVGYDTNGHGMAGWRYISDRDGLWHWTKGQPSRPFFYQTYMDLIRMAQQEFSNLKI